MQRIVPFVWFNGQAEEAMHLDVAVQDRFGLR